MRPGETLVEMARRHVREGEAHVQKQRAIIERLRDANVETSTAEDLLAEFEECLAEHRMSLERMLEEQRLGQRNAAGDRI